MTFRNQATVMKTGLVVGAFVAAPGQMFEEWLVFSGLDRKAFDSLPHSCPLGSIVLTNRGSSLPLMVEGERDHA